MFNKELLKAYMEEHNLTCQAFGEQVGVSGAMVSYLLRGFKQPSLALLSSICKVTGYTADQLIMGEGE